MLESKKENIKKENRKYIFLKLTGWILTLVIATMWIFLKLEKRFAGNLNDIDVDSFIAYKNSIGIMALITGGLMFLWWIIPLVILSIQDFWERNTLLCAVLVIVTQICITVAVLYTFPGVKRADESASLIEQWYVLFYPSLFISGILLFSPNNVCEVIIPCKKWIRYLLGWGIIIADILVCLWGEN